MKAYKKVRPTGGSVTDLDGVDGNLLEDGDFAYVFYNGRIHFYELDANSELDAAPPYIVVPISNAGPKRWIMSVPEDVYTKSEISTQMTGKANVNHGHTLDNITETAGEKKMTSAERTKLAGIAESANKYAHPATHSLSIISETSSQKKMTSTERTKLAGIATGANKYAHPSKHPASIITQSSSYRFCTDAQKSSYAGKPNLGEGSGNAYRGDRGKVAYNHSQAGHAPSNANYLALGSSSSKAYRGDRGTIAYNHSQAAHASIVTEANVAAANLTVTEKIYTVVASINLGTVAAGSIYVLSGGFYTVAATNPAHVFGNNGVTLQIKQTGTAGFKINGGTDMRTQGLTRIMSGRMAGSANMVITSSGSCVAQLVMYFYGREGGTTVTCYYPQFSAIKLK